MLWKFQGKHFIIGDPAAGLDDPLPKSIRDDTWIPLPVIWNPLDEMHL